MEERNKKFKALFIGLLIIVIASIIPSVACLSLCEDMPLIGVAAVVSVLGQIVALYYGFGGYRKNDALAYKIYMIIFDITLWLGIINRGMYMDGTVSAVTMGTMAIQFACIAIIVVAENLGKKKSLILCGIVLIFTSAAFALSLFASLGVLRGGTDFGTLSVSRSGSVFVQAVIAFIITKAKYMDKNLRSII